MMDFYFTVHVSASGTGSRRAMDQIRSGVVDEQLKEAVAETVENILIDYEPELSLGDDEPEIEYEVVVTKLKIG